MKTELVENAIRRFANGRGTQVKGVPTVKEYADKWYQVTWKPKETNGKNTACNVHTAVYTHIIPRFGERKIDEVKRSDVQAYANELQAQGKAESTIDKIMIYLGKIFEMAVDEEWIHKSPAIKIEKGNRRTKRDALTMERTKRLVESMKNLSAQDMLLIAIPLFAGTRKEETLGLQWCDIDWERHTITIERAVKTLRYPRYHVEIGTLKSQSSYRTVPLLPELEAILLPLRGNGIEQIVSGTKLMTNSAYDRAWQRIEKNIDLHGVTAHVLRHTFATFAVNKTDMKTLQYIMGHSEISITMDTYAHVRPDIVNGLHVTLNNMYGGMANGQGIGQADEPAKPHAATA